MPTLTKTVDPIYLRKEVEEVGLDGWHDLCCYEHVRVACVRPERHFLLQLRSRLNARYSGIQIANDPLQLEYYFVMEMVISCSLFRLWRTYSSF